MAYPLLSDMVIVWGSWFDERTRQGETLPVTFTPLVSPASSETPLLTVAAENAWIKTREWKVIPDPATGFFAVPLTPNNDPDVTAFSGYRITPGGETPRTAEVPADADTMTVTAQMRDYLQKLSPPISVTIGDTVKAKKVTELALIDPAPVPPESFFDSTQTTAAIASGILAHDTDPEAHPDIRGLIGAGGDLKQWAANPDALIVGTITRDANETATSAGVVWPDGTAGTYTATTVSSAFPGAVDAYTITYGSPATKTYTQPAVTRDTTGAVIQRPAIEVS